LVCVGRSVRNPHRLRGHRKVMAHPLTRHAYSAGPGSAIAAASYRPRHNGLRVRCPASAGHFVFDPARRKVHVLSRQAIYAQRHFGGTAYRHRALMHTARARVAKGAKSLFGMRAGPAPRSPQAAVPSDVVACGNGSS
jgi:hypothetical protein